MHPNSGRTEPENSDNKSRWAQSTSITLGANYQSPVKPFAKRLAVPSEGITDKQRDLELAKLQKIGNKWQVLGKHFEVEKQMHNAHQKQYDAMGAAVQTGTSLVNAATTWNKYQVAVANNRISRSEKNTAIRSIEVEVERHGIDLEKKKAALDKAKLELEQAIRSNAQTRLSMDADRELALIVGNPVEVTLPTFMQNLSGLLQPVQDIQFDE